MMRHYQPDEQSAWMDLVTLAAIVVAVLALGVSLGMMVTG